MKSIKLMFIMCFLSTIMYAQEETYTHSLDGIKWVKIDSKTNIIVKSHNEDHMLIKGGHRSKTPEKAKGLKLVGSGGVANTNVDFYVEKDGDVLIVKNLKNMTKPGNTEIYLPASQNVSVLSSGLQNMFIEGFEGEIEAKASVTGNILIRDVTGPLTANSNTGAVEVTFTKVSQASPISISTATGKIDVSIPGNTPANLTLNSTMGEVHTNFDFTMSTKDGLKVISNKKIKRTINNGGVNIRLNSATGNIYLRKN